MSIIRNNDHFTQEYLKTILTYDSITGLFYWNNSKPGIRKDRVAGSLKNGHIYIQHGNEKYLAHRLAWLYVSGEWPKNEIDHKNNIGNDNRWCNLREATRGQNNYNSSLYSNNSSGYKGVSWHIREKRWRAYIRIHTKRINIGSYNIKEEAALAYNKAAIKHFGDYAKLNEVKAELETK